MAGVTAWQEIDVAHGELRVRASVAGEAGWAILDSSSVLNGVAPHLLDRPGVDVRRGGDRGLSFRGKYREVDQYHGLDAVVMGAALTLNDLAPQPLPDGVLLRLGSGFLQRAVVQVDYPGRRMRLLTRDAIDLDGPTGLDVERLERSDRMLVKVRIADERDLWVMLDTSLASGLQLRRLVSSMRGWTDRWRTGPAPGTTGWDQLAVPAVQLGPWRLEDVVARVPTGMMDHEKVMRSAVSIQQTRVDGAIGFDVLRHFVVTMDLREGVLHLALPDAP